mgnify:FL=1
MLTPARAVTVPNRLTISLVVISGVLMSLISSSSWNDSDSVRTAVEVVLGIPLGQPIPGLPAQVDRTRYLGSVQLRFSPRWLGRARPTHEAVAARRIAELTASRREIVAAYEIERRRIERDLHDGAQQRLVVGLMKLGEAQLSPAVTADPALAALLAEAKSAIAGGLESLRPTVRGIHPQVLTDLGLEAALTDAVDRVDRTGRTIRIVCPHSVSYTHL